ncbi:hypothetical protein C7S18_02690 [Ahniella affigens]|uniref:Sortilin N-terminal domain-containing protein n=1 Tax=Ahniella affigens TaxID=2021234 RepID=A0A2P1PMW9_9GAMM|nr:hypothetical protein [Ahniella affigens]AVP96167.1 hypothetical protein C7S18_02690 [Ahniella affigens]
MQRHKRLTWILAATLCVGGAAEVDAGDGVWTSSGPKGGTVNVLLPHPGNANILYASTAGNVFKSIDGGTTFTQASNGIVANSIYPLPLMLDAEAPDHLFTADSSGRKYRTFNGAQTWEIYDGDLPDEIIPGMAVDQPGSSCTFLLSTGTQRFLNEPMLWRTTDCGNQFERIGNGLPGDEYVTAIAFQDNDPLNVLVGMGNSSALHASIWRSTDGGKHFSAVHDVSIARGYTPGVQAIAFGAGQTVWAVVDYYLLHSTDDGLTWTEIEYGSPFPQRLAASTVFPVPGLADKAYAGRADGVFAVLYSATPSPSYDVVHFSQGLTPNASYTASGNPIPAAVNQLTASPGFPSSGGFLYATTDGSGIFRRPPVDVSLNPPWSSAINQNPGGNRITQVAIHPHPIYAVPGPGGGYSSRLMAAQNNVSPSSPALYATDDGGGETWYPANQGLRAADLNALVLDPTTGIADQATTAIYAGGKPAVAETAYQNGGLYRSDDNGTNWANIDGDLPVVSGQTYVDLGSVQAIALDPRSCTSPPVSGPCVSGPLNTIYALAEGQLLQPIPGQYRFSHQIIRSDNRGTNWVSLSENPGFPISAADAEIVEKVVPISMAVSPVNANLLLVGTRSEYLDTSPGSGNSPADLHSGLFRSTDRGATWTHITNGLDQKHGLNNTYLDITAIAFHPTQPNTVFLAATDFASSSRSTIYVSTDGGLTFDETDRGLNDSVYLRGLAIDPSNPSLMYAVGSGFEANPGAVFRSDDSGQHWYSISVGLPAESAYSIAVDPHVGSYLHVATDNGVWSLNLLQDTDHDGIPDSVENSGPNNGDSNNDGTLDALQGDVGSIGVALRGGGGGSGASTVDVVNGTGPGGVGCTQSVDVQRQPLGEYGEDIEPISGDTFHRQDALHTFEIQDCLQATVNVTFHGQTYGGYGWEFRYFGPSVPGDSDSIGWFTLPANRVRRLGASTWQLSLSNSELGNYRPASDNAIRFVGVPACRPDDRLTQNSFENTETPVASCYPP